MSTAPRALPASRVPDPMSAPPIRWGVLAPGWIAGLFTGALHRHSRSRVVAVGSRSGERARAFATEYGVERAYGSYAELVADPEIDAVYVASPHSHHHELARLALAHGHPTLVEKAFTQNAAQAENLVTLARDSGLLLMEAMWTRFLPHLDVVRSLLEGGDLGEVQTVISDHGQYFDLEPTHRLLNPELAGGALLDLGIYPVSFTSFVLGAPDEITATASLASTGVDAQVSAILRRGAAHGLVSATQTAATPTTASVSGSAGRIEISGPFYMPGTVRLVANDGSAVETTPSTPPRHEGLVYQAAHFATLLAEGRTESPLITPGESLAILRTCDEIRRQIGVVYPDEKG